MLGYFVRAGWKKWSGIWHCWVASVPRGGFPYFWFRWFYCFLMDLFLFSEIFTLLMITTAPPCDDCTLIRIECLVTPKYAMVLSLCFEIWHNCRITLVKPERAFCPRTQAKPLAHVKTEVREPLAFSKSAYIRRAGLEPPTSEPHAVCREYCRWLFQKMY